MKRAERRPYGFHDLPAPLNLAPESTPPPTMWTASGPSCSSTSASTPKCWPRRKVPGRTCRRRSDARRSGSSAAPILCPDHDSAVAAHVRASSHLPAWRDTGLRIRRRQHPAARAVWLRLFEFLNCCFCDGLLDGLHTRAPRTARSMFAPFSLRVCAHMQPNTGH